VNARFYKSNNELTAADRAFLEAKAAENAAIKALSDAVQTYGQHSSEAAAALSAIPPAMAARATAYEAATLLMPTQPGT
jgi:hypothetical protein